MENGEEFRDWSKIPTNLLEECCKRLNMPDQLRLGAVCKTWHSSTSNKAHLSSSETPWLIYNREDSFRFCIFALIGPRRYFKIHKPFRPFHGSVIIGSTEAWLFIWSHPKMIFVNIFSRICIDLPPQSTFPALLTSPRASSSISNNVIDNRNVNDNGIGMDTPLGFAISTCSNLNPINVVVLTKGGDLAWCNHTEDTWKGHRGSMEYGNITFHDGKLFAVSRDGSKIDMFHVDDTKDQLIIVGSIDSPNLTTPGIPNGQVDMYLVESKGSLLVLKRYYNDSRFKQTIRFQIFKVEKDEENSTLRVVLLNMPTSLEGHILFVSSGLSCESVDVAQCPGFLEDHIYFIGHSGNATTSEFGMFSVANGHLVDQVPLPKTDVYKSPIWVMARVAFECDCPNHDLQLFKPNNDSGKRKFHQIK